MSFFYVNEEKTKSKKKDELSPIVLDIIHARYIFKVSTKLVKYIDGLLKHYINIHIVINDCLQSN